MVGCAWNMLMSNHEWFLFKCAFFWLTLSVLKRCPKKTRGYLLELLN